MMKVQYKTGNGRLTFEFESESDKTLVTSLAHIQEIFEEPECGCCKSKLIRYDVREFDGNRYYKLLCEACGATLDFGQNKQGDTLFVKRFEKETRNPLPNKGWYKYGDTTKPNQQQQQQAAKPTAMPSANSSTKPARPTTTPATPAKPAPKPAKSKHQNVLDAYADAKTEERVHVIAKWAKEQDFAPHQDDEQADAFHAALERVCPMVGAGVDNDIPF